MADERLEQIFRFRPWHIGDPAVLVESILTQVEADQRRAILGHYLDSVVATHEANLKFVQNVRSVIGRVK
jgi:hypothetical protein